MRDALLLIDVVNDFEHEDGDALLASFRRRHARLETELESARGTIPVAYANDDWGRWDGDAPGLVSKRDRGRPRRRPGRHGGAQTG